LGFSAPFVFGRFEVPADNPLTEESVELGRRLFYDRRLSGDDTVSCSTCHRQRLAFTDGRRTGIGVSGKPLAFNSMSLANLMWGAQHFFWNGRAATLEAQTLVPIQHPDEMAEDLQRLVAELSADDSYRALFETAYGEISAAAISRALASFVRTLISSNSRYDQFLRGEIRLKAQEEWGRKLFMAHPDVKVSLRGGNCIDCHSQFLTSGFHTPGRFSNNGLDDEEQLQQPPVSHRRPGASREVQGSNPEEYRAYRALHARRPLCDPQGGAASLQRWHPQEQHAQSTDRRGGQPGRRIAGRNQPAPQGSGTEGDHSLPAHADGQRFRDGGTVLRPVRAEVMRMNRTSLVAAVLATAAVVYAAARFLDHAAQPVELTLQLHPFVGAEPLFLNEMRYANPGGEGSFEVRDFQFFLSNIRLAGDTGAYAEPDSYHLVRFDAAQATYVVTLHDVPRRDYNRIEFGIGVDPAANRSVESRGDLDPNGRMAWTWDVGYKFVLLEGFRVTACASRSSTRRLRRELQADLDPLRCGALGHSRRESELSGGPAQDVHRARDRRHGGAVEREIRSE
jgi:hypothetical protein